MMMVSSTMSVAPAGVSPPRLMVLLVVELHQITRKAIWPLAVYHPGSHMHVLFGVNWPCTQIGGAWCTGVNPPSGDADGSAR